MMLTSCARRLRCALLMLAALGIGSARAQSPGAAPGTPPVASPVAPATAVGSAAVAPGAPRLPTPQAPDHGAEPSGGAQGAGTGTSAMPATPPPSAAAPAPAAPSSNPHAGLGSEVPRDESAPAQDVPVGAVEALILDANGNPLASTPVRLGILFQRISEGETRSERSAVSDAQGRVRFDALKVGSEHSYRITVKQAPAEYGSAPFTLGAEAGHRVRLHVFPVTTEVTAAPVGMRGFIYIEPRDDVFQFEVLFRIFNVGAVTWVPKDVIMKLPSGFKAFSSPAGMTDVGFEHVEGQGARLKGTFFPGQHDVNLRFQVSKEGDPTATFGIGMLPRVAEMRVIVEASSQMALGVEGFEEPQVASNQKGKRVLVTRRLFDRGGQAESQFAVTVSGLPVPGPGRWIAVMIAGALAFTGFGAASGRVRLDSARGSRINHDLLTARELLLQEIVKVEEARRDGALGPRAYADARRTLLESLARLGRDALQPEAKASKAKRQAAA
ncbi:MAG TPA: hypothetical protein VER33_18720 [Polyangiaceae bacterium]|nr:hypothetical protein [Polyangiaceae bacterium]